MIHEITQTVGKYKAKKRIGRGPGSGKGKTSGRGEKGAGSRSGFSGSIHPAYAGGQMPYFRRIPKRGFNNTLFRKVYSVVNLQAIEKAFQDNAEVNAESLVAAGIIKDARTPVKILAEGNLSRKVKVSAHKFSQAAIQKIEAAGGSVTILS